MSQPPLGITAPALRSLLERYLQPWCFTDITIGDIADIITDANGDIVTAVSTDGTTITGGGLSGPNGDTQTPISLVKPQAGILKAGVAAVTAGAFNVAVGLAPAFAHTVIMALPNWNTTVYFSGDSANGFTLNFGTACPPGGGTVMWALT